MMGLYACGKCMDRYRLIHSPTWTIAQVSCEVCMATYTPLFWTSEVHRRVGNSPTVDFQLKQRASIRSRVLRRAADYRHIRDEKQTTLDQAPAFHREGNKGGDATMDAKEKLMRIVEHAKGDDLERAERAFRGLSDEEMSQGHGGSSMSRAQILDEYRTQRREWEAARDLALTL